MIWVLLGIALVVFLVVRRARRGTPPTVIVGPTPGRIRSPRRGERL